MANKSKILNWLLLNDNESASKKISNSISNDKKTFRQEKKNKFVRTDKLLKNEKLNKKTLKQKFKSFEVEENELIKSPISGTYIIKDWNIDKKLQKDKNLKQKSSNELCKFTKSEIALNSIAASFVEITPQSRARLAKIPNKIGPYECKLCKIVYNDAFELAMHNCPRVVHIEYRCSECNKVFNCPANLASHKRWHKPKEVVLNDEKVKKIKLDNNESIFKQEFELLKIKETFSKFQNNNFHESNINQEKSQSWQEVSSYDLNSNQLFYNQFLYHQYPDGITNSNFNFALNPSLKLQAQSDWFKQIYSNYFTVATQTLLSGVFPSTISDGLFSHKNQFNSISFPNY